MLEISEGRHGQELPRAVMLEMKSKVKRNFLTHWGRCTFLAEGMADGKIWNMRQAGVFGNYRNLGILENTEPAKRGDRLRTFARALRARLWIEASFYRLKSALSRLET